MSNDSVAELEAKLREADKKYRKLEREHTALLRPTRVVEEMAENSKTMLMGSQQELQGEIEERRATEIELGKLIEEIDIARQSRETFLSILTQQLEAPLKGALGMLEIIASRPLDRTQKDLLTLAVTSVQTMQALLRSAESISETHRDKDLGDETLRQMLSAKTQKD